MLRRVQRPPPPLQQWSRTYAISISNPVVYPNKPLDRQYNPRKTHLVHFYGSLLQASHTSPILLLRHHNFNVKSLIKLRRDIAAASLLHTPAALEDAGLQSVSSEQKLERNPASQATLTVIRTSLFGVALRNISKLDEETQAGIANVVESELAALTLPSLHPPELQAILRVLDRAVPKPKPKPDAASSSSAKNAAAEDTTTPGRRIKRVKKTLTPELSLLGALIEGRLFSVERTRDVAGLPTLGTLRAQIVGLIGSPAMQLAAVLSQASGGTLVRTLEGFKKGLEDEQAAP